MKIAITASGDNLDCQLDPRFGRCQNFLIIDPVTMDFEVMSNESAMASGGAGIQAAQTIVNTGINAIITGNVGPNAFEILSTAGIKTMTGASGTIRDVLAQYNSGILQSTMNATVGNHAGMPRMGSGQRMGRGGQRQGMGPPKECKCPGCGYTIPHQPGQPCANQSCPKCGTNMAGM